MNDKHNHISISDELAGDIIITAVEGGIEYWANIAEYRPFEKPVSAIIEYYDEEDNHQETTLDYALIRKGIDVVLNSPYMGGIPDVLASLFDQRLLDANVADVIVQAGIFGDLVFG